MSVLCSHWTYCKSEQELKSVASLQFSKVLFLQNYHWVALGHW
jgi:hypothetical protein